MDKPEAVICVAIGLLGIVVGILNKRFYAATGFTGTDSGKLVERWKGRLLFLIVGALFLIVGLRNLFG